MHSSYPATYEHEASRSTATANCVQTRRCSTYLYHDRPPTLLFPNLSHRTCRVLAIFKHNTTRHDMLRTRLHEHEHLAIRCDSKVHVYIKRQADTAHGPRAISLRTRPIFLRLHNTRNVTDRRRHRHTQPLPPRLCSTSSLRISHPSLVFARRALLSSLPALPCRIA